MSNKVTFPEGDFVAAKFDYAPVTQPKTLLFIYGTSRSGKAAGLGAENPPNSPVQNCRAISNLHGHHVKHWKAAKPYLPTSLTKTIHIHLQRRDRVAQAVSYNVAKQTNQWSAAFGAEKSRTYDYDAIAGHLRELAGMDKMIKQHPRAEQQVAQTLFYEDVTDNPMLFLRYLDVGIMPQSNEKVTRQATQINHDFIARFH